MCLFYEEYSHYVNICLSFDSKDIVEGICNFFEGSRMSHGHRPTWMYAIPMIHFLMGVSSPTEKKVYKYSDRIWWGLIPFTAKDLHKACREEAWNGFVTIF